MNNQDTQELLPYRVEVAREYQRHKDESSTHFVATWGKSDDARHTIDDIVADFRKLIEDKSASSEAPNFSVQLTFEESWYEYKPWCIDAKGENN
jgi:hypothetical protein